VHAAGRSLAGALAELPEPGPAALNACADALRRLATAELGPVAGAVDTRRFNPGVSSLPLSLRDFSFLCVFAAPGPELEAVIRTYVTAFGPADPVSLLLRPDGPDAGDIESWLVELLTGSLGRSLEEIPDMLVETASLEAEDLPGLYATGDCFVALASGDPLATQRAMACGVPVIGAGESALEVQMCAAAADPAGSAERGAQARALALRAALGAPA
jgi:glycosyltransferase involved in cell wall biosynthesis